MMNKLTLNKGKAIACLILLCLFLVQGCKREILQPKTINEKTDSRIKTISYAKFISSINLDATGSLKAALSGSKVKLLSTQALDGNLNLELDSVKQLTLGDTTSYVISIKPQTPRATSFQNLTIEVVKAKTTAFLASYYPEKEWIDNWRKNRKTAFKGFITFNKINLDEVGLTNKLNLGVSRGNGDLKDKLLASIGTDNGIANVISLLPGECEIYNVAREVYNPCKYGHYFRETCDYLSIHPNWEPTSNDWPPTITYDISTVVNCAAPSFPSSGGGGGGGGGSTTPNPPGNYDPCNGTPTPVGSGGISFERGTRLMLGAPSDCDELPGPPVITTTMTPQQYLLNNLDLDMQGVGFINNAANAVVVAELAKYLITNGSSVENSTFVKWAVGYLLENPNSFTGFTNVFLNGPIDLTFENVQIENVTGNVLSANDYAIAGLSDNFTESEFDNVIQNLNNDITEDPIQLYMIASYKNSKLLNSSTYAISSNYFMVGEYILCAHYNSKNKIAFYSAFRKSSLGIEYLIRADALNAFKEKYTTYKAAADLFYVNGKPSLSQIQIAAGDYWEGLVESHKEAYSNPTYYLYLAHVFTATAVNLKSVSVSDPVKITVSPVSDPLKWTSTTIKRTVTINIENRTIAQYREMISQKYNASWQNIGDGKFRLEVGQNRYVSYPISTSTLEPTIQYFRNNISIGKFRFKN
ncbi:MAG: hypothetical protein EOO86_14365 [Pedobacter sp.]|nr:MAG: hypothetical protein EOO86_14365 [Pedobacter sp.]